MKTATRKTVRGATALNEMAILEREGRQGFQLVDFGVLRLDFEQSDRPWEHRRLIMPSPKTLAAMQADGWVVVGTWAGTFTYLKRPVRA